MKKFASILFIVGLVASIATLNMAGAVVCAIGLYFSNASYASPIAGINLYPMKYAIMNAQGTPEEVPFVTRAERELYQQLIILGRANPVTAKAIAEDGISYDPISYYLRYNITGLSGSITLLGPSTLRVPGTTNFPNGATLSQYYNFCFDRIAIRTAVTNTANTAVYAVGPLNSSGGWSGVRNSIDPAISSGELIIRSNRNVIVETPVIDFLAEAAVTGGGIREYAGGILEKPRFFLELLQNEVQLVCAPGATVVNTVNTTTWFEMQYMGVQARLKS